MLIFLFNYKNIIQAQFFSLSQSRCSVKEKVTSARPRVSEVSVLPPIDMGGWSNVPTDGTYTGPLNYRWQRVADNFIDSDVRVRSRYKRNVFK